MAFLDVSFSDVLGTWRDVETAKRSNPKLVQAVEHNQTPLPQNVQAPATPAGVGPAKNEVGTPVSMFTQRNMLIVGGGLLGLFLIFKLAK